jgi:hypothetical protein
MGIMWNLIYCDFLVYELVKIIQTNNVYKFTQVSSFTNSLKDINPLKTKRNLLCIKTLFVSRSKHYEPWL